MKRISFFVLLLLADITPVFTQNWVQYVDPFIGTGGHGHTFPGATLPFAMVQLSPDTRVDGSWDGCSGYHYSDNTIYGFSHTHLSGTGCSDYGDVMLMPVQKEISFDPKVYSSRFSHSKESATPGYYSVVLDDENIKVELTTTTRAGLHRYTFPQGGKASVILDLSHRDELLGFELKKVGDNRLMGMRRSKAWAKDQTVYFTIEFSKPITTMAYCIDGKVIDKPKDVLPTSYKKVQVRFDFDLATATSLEVKVGLSPVDMLGSQMNLQTETGTRSFDEIRQLATDTWNKELGKIEVQGGTKEQLTNFYTALYHCMIAPNIYMDTDNRYRGRDGQVHTAEGFSYYTVFSLWDTFRALHPLLSIIDKQRSKDFAQTFLVQYQQGGRLPVWELSGNETDCMIGYHAVSVLADLAAKGLLTDEQIKLAYEAAIKSATWNHYGLPAMMDHGYLSVDDESESVSKTLEYAYNDWCITRLGELSGKTREELMPYYHRAQAYANVFDPESRFFRPRKNGGWLNPFEPREVNNHYTEANAWQYRFFVPHDIPRTLFMMGGKERYVNKLDSMFTITSKTTGREQADITGCIGQYAHGNEPSHSFAYHFSHAGLPWKTQHYVRLIMDSLYHAATDGLPGNEDCGQMSAWYVFSAMGLYPVTPGIAYYTWGTPLFEQVSIHLENGNTVRIKRSGGDASCRYISGVTMNGISYTGNGIDHQTLMFGPELNFTMQATPRNVSGWGAPDGLFMDRELAKTFTAVPVILSGGMSFDDKTTIKIESLNAGANLFYAIQTGNSELQFQPYTQALVIDQSCTVYAKAVSNTGVESKLAIARFVKKPHLWTVKINSQYNPQYTAGGDGGIIDGILADENWRKGGWQGYQAQDMEVIIDLLTPTPIHAIGSRYLQDMGSWILLPNRVEYWSSDDGQTFTPLGTVTHSVKPDDPVTLIKELRLNSISVTARYIKVKAYNFGKLPAWHPGSGGDAFIFCDEIVIE